jgi:hypothetical protein
LEGAFNSQPNDGLVSVRPSRQRLGHGGAEDESHREVISRRELESGQVDGTDSHRRCPAGLEDGVEGSTPRRAGGEARSKTFIKTEHLRSSCREIAEASGGHFAIYTASVVYGGVGATEFGVSRSKLWNPFDSEVKGGEQASREFAAWLISDSAILEAYCEAIAGREVVCDCGLDDCPCVLLNTVARGARFRPAGLLTNPEWRLRVRTTLEKSCDVKYLGDCITKFIAAKAGGISECARLLFVPVPNSHRPR